MEPTSATSATSAAGATGKPAASGSGGFINSDFETFLKMMTTQLRNQDPLNPLDSADFAVQLATFSNVEQQVRTNVLLEKLSAQIGLSGMAELAGFVGMEARVAAPASFRGEPVELSLGLARGADSGVLVVTDEHGTERQRLVIDTTAPFHLWEGVDDGGTPFPPGAYSFAVESYSGDQLVDTRPAPVYALVAEARLENGETMLLLDGGATVAAREVTALRYPVVYGQEDGGAAGGA